MEMRSTEQVQPVWSLALELLEMGLEALGMLIHIDPNQLVEH
jgi:hypothetical protein